MQLNSTYLILSKQLSQQT